MTNGRRLLGLVLVVVLAAAIVFGVRRARPPEPAAATPAGPVPAAAPPAPVSAAPATLDAGAAPAATAARTVEEPPYPIVWRDVAVGKERREPGDAGAGGPAVHEDASQQEGAPDGDAADAACADARRSEATLASLREALSLTLPARAERLRGWFCDPTQAPLAKGLLQQAGRALRPPSDAGAAALTPEEARRAICGLPWSPALSIDPRPPQSVDELFACPDCPNQDCAEDPDCACGAPDDTAARYNDPDCLFGYSQDSYRFLTVEPYQACGLEARDARGAWQRAAAGRVLARRAPEAGAPCLAVQESGTDVRLRLDDGSWKTFLWDPRDVESSIYSVQEVDCAGRRVTLSAGAPRGYLVVHAGGGAVTEDFEAPPEWSPGRRFFVGGWHDPELNGPAPAASIWSCEGAAKPCRLVWSLADLPLERQRGGLTSAQWKSDHRLELQLSDHPPLLCDCTTEACDCRAADGVPMERPSPGGPSASHLEFTLDGGQQGRYPDTVKVRIPIRVTGE